MMCIYQILNTKNGRFKIGSTKNHSKRWNEHKRKLRNNKHENRFLQRDWNKCGADNFMFGILEVIYDESKLLEREDVWREIFWNTDKLYDLCRKSGKGPDLTGRKRPPRSKEWCANISKSKMGCNKGIKRSEHSEWMKKNSPAYKGQHIQLIHKDGRTYDGFGLCNVARELNLDNSKLCLVLQGKRKSCKGWRLQ